MSHNHEPMRGFDPVLQPIADFWTGYMRESNDSMRQWLEGIDKGSNVKTWQRRWLDAVSKSVEAYLRSPAFLEGMRQNTDLVIRSKQRVNDVVEEMARNANIPMASDISGLFERLHSVEELIISRLEGIERRLASMEAQLVAPQRDNE